MVRGDLSIVDSCRGLCSFVAECAIPLESGIPATSSQWPQLPLHAVLTCKFHTLDLIDYRAVICRALWPFGGVRGARLAGIWQHSQQGVCHDGCDPAGRAAWLP